MTEIIGAPALDDALTALAVRVSEAEARGEKNLIFCEDKLTLLAERAVLRGSGGTVLTEVSTFARFLAGSGRVLSKQGSVAVLSALIEEREERLQTFRESSAQAVYETIAQLSASRVDARLLRESAEETEGVLRCKLCDLALLSEDYEEFLRGKGLTDENGYLALLPEKIERCLAGTNVFFFGFASFTAQAREGVRAALSCAKNVTGIFIAGREPLYTNEGARVFRSVCSEAGDVKVAMLAKTFCKEARMLAEGLFSPEKLALPPAAAEHIHIFRPKDETEEFQTVCTLIKAYVRAGLRYRDVAVLADGADLPAAERAFSAYRIPYFADRKRPFSDHPFCAFALSVLDSAADGALPVTADAIASSAYFGNGDNYRNYLLRYGAYRGGVRRAIREVKHFSREELEACRERMLGILALFPAKGTGETYVRAVRALRELVGEEEITRRLSGQVSGAEREFLDLSGLDGVLDEILLVAGERKFTARRFRTLLENALRALSVSMIPQSADAVFLGDAVQSAFARVKILFCTGLTSALPRVSSDTAVVTDGEIARLKALGTEIEPAIAVVNARAREAFALNLCAFSKELYVSCPAVRGGTEQTESEVLSDCEKLFTLAPVPDLFPLGCCEKDPARVALLSLKDEFEAGLEEDERKFSSLYAALKEREGEEIDRLLRGEETQVKEAGRLLLQGEASPTLLETYFTCPYLEFAQRGLKIREREEGTVPDTDAGTFVHSVLEAVAAELNGMESEEACRKRAEEIARELLKTPAYDAFSDTRAGVYAGERLVSESAAASAAAYRQLAGSSFRVRETEAEIKIPALSLRGKADRVDEAEGFVRVIDYKTGSVDDKTVAYYTGRKLQLQLYLLAASAGKSPAGAFYFPAAETFTKQGENPYKLLGFFSGEDGVLSLMDNARGQGEKSAFFEGGGRTEKGMKQKDFEDFLSYSLLVANKAEEEMREGNIAPSPYGDVCGWCRLMGMCGFCGTPRSENAASCAEIVKIVRRERGEE